MDRRDFLRLGAYGGAAAAIAPALPFSIVPALAGGPDGPYGPLLPPDANGIMLPEGFTVREIAAAGQPVGREDYLWHLFPDGGATFPRKRRGWIYVSNSEAETDGGVSAVTFDAAGEVVDAYRILGGTQMNCAGGPTPWGTWLSCEEYPEGRVWECDPTGKQRARARPALGVFQHEAVAVDRGRKQLYLTEDVPDSCFYRFTPDDYPSLETGRLEVAEVGDRGRVEWKEVPDPRARDEPTREQIRTSTGFNGGEGIWYDGGRVYFTTKGDVKVWVYDAARERLATLFDPVEQPGTTLSSVDNLTLTPAGNVLVAEDQDEEQELALITVDGAVVPLLRVTTHSGSELTGPAFSPNGDHLYFSSQRGGDGGGITYAMTGPFAKTERQARQNALGGPGPALALMGAGALRRLRERT